ncbi:recombinase family protein [Chitinibacter sp. ZOR0017]|uniref:recombinase family protein n=1 Tax=Chitinibacter sp. ZOR0017 TaxID=1339254 RepID=UPI000646FE36|nr:recombinase family protein [Chitinibacter sp. ZOR0017]
MLFYYGRVSTSEQNLEQQRREAAELGCERSYFDEGVSGYHIAPVERKGWKAVLAGIREGDTLYVRWLDRISRRYDELHATMGELMGKGVKVVCTMNGMEFDGLTDDPMKKAVRDAVLAFMAAQGEADYKNRREMQTRGIAIAKQEGRYRGKPKTIDDAQVKAWKAEHGATIKATADYFGISVSSVKRACAE